DLCWRSPTRRAWCGLLALAALGLETCWSVRRAAVPRLKASSPTRVQPAWTMSRLRELCASSGTSQVLQEQGVAVLPAAFEADMLEAVLKAFIGLERRQKTHALRFGDLRVARTPVHLPYQEPFRSLPLLGRDEALREVLANYLGDNFELESAMVITVSPNAGAQNAHLDTEDAGSVSVHVPLQPLHEGFAPLSFCVGSHAEPDVLMRAARPASVVPAPQQRLARKRQRRATAKEEHFLKWGPAQVEQLGEVDFRRGKSRCLVRGLKENTLGLQLGDEVTHVNELDFMSWLLVKDHVPDFRKNLMVRVLRPIKEEDQEAEPGRPREPRQLRVWMGKRHQHRLLVGAPLELGDAIMYDSRTVHWGMANKEDYTRYVLYLNFKRRNFMGISPDEMAIQLARKPCRIAREDFQDKLVRELHYLEDGPF
ncbi:unnamed protein product, partial [Effrenium voratum]